MHYGPVAEPIEQHCKRHGCATIQQICHESCFNILCVLILAASSPNLTAAPIHTVETKLEETFGNTLDLFSINFTSTDPLAQITEVAFDLSRSTGGVTFDTASNLAFNVGRGCSNCGFDLQVVESGGVSLATDLGFDFQFALDGSQNLRLQFEDFTSGKRFVLGGDFDRTIPTPKPLVAPRDLENGLFAARISAPDKPDTVVTGTFGPDGATGTAKSIPPAPLRKTFFNEGALDPTNPFDLGLIADPQRPTIVLTHGWQEKDPDRNLWTGFFEIKDAGTLLRAALGDSVNIVQYVWEGAFQRGRIPDHEEYKTARQYVQDAGINLAKQLLAALGEDYSQPIHFIGHSLGTIVNAYAARLVLITAPNIPKAQFTIFEHPQRVGKLFVTGTPEEKMAFEKAFGYSDSFFATNLPKKGNLFIDNYYASSRGFGVGDKVKGPVFNHALVDPGKVGDAFFPEEASRGFIDNDHTGVHQWYRWTIIPNDPFPVGDTVCAGNIFDTARQPNGFHDSLNPCGGDDGDAGTDMDGGWKIAILNSDTGRPSFPAPNSGDDIQLSTATLSLFDFVSLGNCEQTSLDSTNLTITCSESSSSFGVAGVDIPEEADYLSFEYMFLNIGDGDYATIFLGDVPIWTVAAESSIIGEFMDSGPIPISGLKGHQELTIALNGVGEPSAQVTIRKIRTVAVKTVAVSVEQCFRIPATILGTNGRERLNGTSGRDIIVGLGGNDIINGKGGKDLICGGKGRDKLKGGKGRDKLDGGAGRDVCNGGSGRDTARRCERISKIP